MGHAVIGKMLGMVFRGNGVGWVGFRLHIRVTIKERICKIVFFITASACEERVISRFRALVSSGNSPLISPIQHFYGGITSNLLMSGCRSGELQLTMHNIVTNSVP